MQINIPSHRHLLSLEYQIGQTNNNLLSQGEPGKIKLTQILQIGLRLADLVAVTYSGKKQWMGIVMQVLMLNLVWIFLEKSTNQEVSDTVSCT